MTKLLEIINGDTLPAKLITCKNTRWKFEKGVKICECKAKDLIFSSKDLNKPGKMCYYYMAIYYNEVADEYYHLVKHRYVNPKKDSDKEFSKRGRLLKSNTNQWDIYRFETKYEAGVLGQNMAEFLLNNYYEHVEKMKIIKEKAAMKKAKKHEDEMKKRNKQNSKIVNSFHEKTYIDKWRGIVL